MRQRVTLEKRVLFDSLICKYVFIRFFDNVLYNYVKEKDVHKILDKVSTGILIYLYNSRALHSLIVKIWIIHQSGLCCFSCRAPLSILILCNPSFLCCPRKIWRPIPDNLSIKEMINFCLFVPFGWFSFVFSCSVFQDKDRDQPTTVHAKINCVWRPNWFHFLIFCNGLLLNISIYWYIKSDWKFPQCVIFFFLFSTTYQIWNISQTFCWKKNDSLSLKICYLE